MFTRDGTIVFIRGGGRDDTALSLRGAPHLKGENRASASLIFCRALKYFLQDIFERQKKGYSVTNIAHFVVWELVTSNMTKPTHH